MKRALATVKVKGLANAVRIYDLVTKHTYAELEAILPETIGGNLVLGFRGELGQIQEAAVVMSEYMGLRNIEHEISVIPNFDFGILELDGKPLHLKN